MKIKNSLIVFILTAGTLTISLDTAISQTRSNYQNNRAPLKSKPYIELPLGAIKPDGWLKEMLLRQKNGSTGQLDKLYPKVMGERNGWLGGDGDQWERGPYWIDGLLPLAYILNDKELIAKTKPWIEWALNSQKPDGHFGPDKDFGPEPGLQRNNSRDWWPKMVMLKILKQYYSATGDKRVINLMTNYFKYQLKELPQTPLDNWTYWARYRGGDNLMMVYWLYNITGDKFLLDLAEIIHKQTFDYTHSFLKTDLLSSKGNIHCVNLAQGIKAPIIYYQHHPEQKYLEAVNKGFTDLMKYNGMAHGLYGGDEALHGDNPTQGSELCTAVEMMFSLESILEITGNTDYADRLEKIAFNALPAQTTDDYMARQYFQQANQVMLTRHIRNFDINHNGTDVVFGLLSGYPCCTSNMHQGWPKFTQNLWYATADNGVAALIYSPSEVTAKVADGTEIQIKEETNYPFDETVKFTITFNKKAKEVSFPFHLRIPGWCDNAAVLINGKAYQAQPQSGIVKINRAWKSGDIVELRLPMQVRKSTWHENSMAVERGPLTYALKMGEKWTKVKNNQADSVHYGSSYYEVYPSTPWNYGLLEVKDDKLQESFEVVKKSRVPVFPWNMDNAPITIKAKAKRIPSWKLYNDMAGPIPYSITYRLETADEVEEISLIPYGCTTLRISQFPVIGNR